MKIAFITTGYFPIPPTKGGAVENLVYSLIKQNEDQNIHHFTVFSSHDKFASEIAPKYKQTEFKYIKTPLVLCVLDKIIYFLATKVLKKEKNLSYRYVTQRLFFARKVSGEIKETEFDRIVVENTPASFLAVKWKGNTERYGDKVIYHLHNEIGFSFGCDSIITQVGLVIGISEFVLRKFKEKYPGYQGEMVVLKNCITRQDTIARAKNFRNIREQYCIPQNAFLVVFAGRLSPEKGVMELMKAFNNLNIENSRLIIVGGTYYGSGVISSYEKQLYHESEHMNGKVIFTGYVDRALVDLFYISADAVVLPSMWNEPAGLTIIEAMLSGTPVITTQSGGIPEYVGNENCIMLERDRDIVLSISKTLRGIYENRNAYESMAKRAKDYVMQYTPENYYKNFCDILEPDRHKIETHRDI